MKTRVELVLLYYARSHTRCYKVTISLVSKVGGPFIPSVTVLLAWLTATAPNLCMTKQLQHRLRKIFHQPVQQVSPTLATSMLLCLPLTWGRQRQPNTLTIIEMCCSLVFVLHYSEFSELTMINRYETVSIRVSRIEPESIYLQLFITKIFKIKVVT